MSLPSFTITGTIFDLLGNIAGGEIVGNGLMGADGTPAKITFTSNADGKFVHWSGDGSLDRVRVIVADVNSDGSITRSGDPVKLLANDAGLSLDQIQWQCHVGWERFWFDAPSDGGSVDLGSVAPVPGVSVVGIASLDWNSVTGKPAVMAVGATAADARAAIGIDLADLDEVDWYANFAAFPGTGVTDAIYGARDTGILYRWNGSVYSQVGGGALSANLSALSGLTSAANKGIQFTGSGTAATYDLTTAGKALLDDPDAAAQRATLGATAQWVAGVGNGSTNDRAAIAAADTAAQSGNIPVLFPAGTYRVSTALTITSPVVFQPGATIKPDSGITVTLTGGVTAAPTQRIFDHSASGLVVPKNVDFYHPGWWGAVNSSDDTAAWTAMVAALAAAGNTVIGIPFSYRVIVPKGTNTMLGVAVTSCELVAGIGTSVFVPPTAATSGVVLTLGNYARLIGGSFATPQSGQAVTCLYLQGYRAQADGIYAFNQAANSTAVKLGDTGQGSTSPILTNARLISGQSTPASGSIGLDVQSSDVQVSNLMVGQYDLGIKGQADSGRLTNVHVWGNNTGLGGTNWDACQVSNVYLDSNRGWGMDIDHMDRAVWDGIYSWNNGNAIGSTGGIRLRQTSGSAQMSTLRGVILDDNVGTGMLVDGTVDYDIECTLSSSQVQAGHAVVTTTGVSITSATTRLTLDLNGVDATTPLADSSTTTRYGRWARNTHAAASKATPVDADAIPLVDSAAGYGSKQLTIANLKALVKMPSHVVASSNLVKNANTTLAVFLTSPTVAGQAYLIRGAIVVAGNQAADMRFRLQNSGATSPSGWFAVAETLANSSTSASAASVQAFNNADIAASGGASVEVGLVTSNRYVVQFSGYLVAGSGGGQSLDCMVAQLTSDASDTTFYAGSYMELMPV